MISKPICLPIHDCHPEPPRHADPHRAERAHHLDLHGAAPEPGPVHAADDARARHLRRHLRLLDRAAEHRLGPVGQSLINGFGWKAAMVAFAAIAASMAVLSLPIRESNEKHSGEKPSNLKLGEALHQAMAHRGYLFMTLAFFACGFQLVFITTHLPAYLQLCGIAPGVGASALALIGLFNTIGTYMFGLLGARYSQKHLLAMIYLLRTLFIIAFLAAPISATSTLVFAAAMGFLWLGVAPLVTGIIGRVFGLTHFNTLYGVVFLSHQVGSFFGAWMGGLVFDRTGNYNFAWGALIVIGITAFTLQWLMDERPPRERKPAGPLAPAAA